MLVGWHYHGMKYKYNPVHTLWKLIEYWNAEIKSFYTLQDISQSGIIKGTNCMVWTMNSLAESW